MRLSLTAVAGGTARDNRYLAVGLPSTMSPPLRLALPRAQTDANRDPPAPELSTKLRDAVLIRHVSEAVPVVVDRVRAGRRTESYVK